MKKLLLGLIGIPYFISGQITISVTDFADGGDTVRMSTTTDLAIDFTSTGPNSVWDYSQLVPETQVLKDFRDMSSASTFVQFMFGVFAAPAYQATNFKASTAIPLDQISGLLPVNITDVYEFSQNNPTMITSVGYALSIDGNEIPFKSDTIETRYELPLSYGDTYTSKGYTNLDMNPIYNGIWRQYRKRTSEVDGWGTITTPYGTFNAIRIDHFIEETDSLYIDAFGTGFWLELPIPDAHVYEWWTNGEKEPILRVNTSLVLGNETPTSVEYRDINRGLAELDELDLDLSLFPNPTQEELNVSGLTRPTLYSIYDASGSLIETRQILPSNPMISVINLQPGAYSLVFQNGPKSKIHPFIKN